MFALADCNNFYVSCERVFRPDLRNKPVVVLSNNDGCVISRSNEAKALGIKMAVPFHHIKSEVSENDIAVFSSNYTLYGDMSSRVMSILQSFVPQMEIYSIDEAFLDLAGMELSGIKEYGEKISMTVTRNTGIPLSMGIAPTKTLAKIANRFAKKYPRYNNVCLIDSEEKRIKSLKLVNIGDVWGIGRRHAKRLSNIGVVTAYDFTQLPESWVKKNMTVLGVRTWRELQGEPCIDMELTIPLKKQICTSRVFAESQKDIEKLKEAVSYYAGICAEKLRKQNAYACSLLVFIHTNNFNRKMAQYSNSFHIKLPVPTNITMEIVHYAILALKNIYRDGFLYKKAGVIITEITNTVQTNIFDQADRKRGEKLMKVVDNLNSGFIRNNVRLGILADKNCLKVKREKLSPCYTTKLDDIIIIK